MRKDEKQWMAEAQQYFGPDFRDCIAKEHMVECQDEHSPFSQLTVTYLKQQMRR